MGLVVQNRFKLTQELAYIIVYYLSYILTLANQERAG